MSRRLEVKTKAGEFIEARMKELGIKTVKELADIAGMSNSGLHQIIHYDMAIQQRSIERLADALQCDRMQILDLLPIRERLRPVPRKDVPKEVGRASSLCWDCRNAVPDSKRGCGCNWSRSFEPVPGWEAAERVSVRIEGGCERAVRSALVIKCPQFKPDREPEDEPEPEDPAQEPPSKWDGTIMFEDEADRMTMEMSYWRI